MPPSGSDGGDEIDWESVAREYAAQQLDTDGDPYADRMETLKSRIRAGDDVTTETLHLTWSTLLSRLSATTETLAPLLTDDSAPDPELVEETLRLFHILSELLWARRADTRDVPQPMLEKSTKKFKLIEDELRAGVPDNPGTRSDLFDINAAEMAEKFEPMDEQGFSDDTEKLPATTLKELSSMVRDAAFQAGDWFVFLLLVWKSETPGIRPTSLSLGNDPSVS